MKLLQFTLRDFLWLVLVAAILMAWRVDHQQSAQEFEMRWKGKAPVMVLPYRSPAGDEKPSPPPSNSDTLFSPKTPEVYSMTLREQLWLVALMAMGCGW
jgi:hypothetical protein